ncbi:MAG: twin-arginine translocation signal domain-containing protein [Deltaproteobacteria bacterium]|jgi:predicted secreted protein|nr:twin-arginine translocation signal domain-containing protein [Deltaproteobacteria bacterium]MCL5880191.1 twin-arginine translocation signal domain-containing protein [Deltaproteobacteria bacterium]MDA8304759.1 twin-arginine translocation signal domain-containing protein [Deltaproteobacteria bacterium]
MNDHVSRRDFIKKTAAITLAALVPVSALGDAATALAAPKAAKPAKKIHIIKTKLEKFEGKEIIWLEKDSAEYKKLMIPRIHLPLLAQNGGLVPLTIDSKYPMKKGDYIRAFHVFDLNNPVPRVASFYLTPDNGRAFIATRIKLQQDSYVQVVTEYSNGSLYGNREFVKVTVGGC